VKPVVFNSTPLIYLTKAGLSKVLEELHGEKLTSSIVKREVVDEGKRREIPDVIVLERLFKIGVFKICQPSDKKFLARLLETRGLHVADAEVLTLAREHSGVVVIDDAVARKTAKVYGIDYAGSPYVLMRAVYEGVISKARAKEGINEMVSAGWRCNVESYAKIMETLEKL
jgi:predicted nucleic acid-binding protein